MKKPKSTKKSKKFNYAVGRYWEGESGSVGCYAYGNTHFYGTMKDAKRFLKYVESKDAHEEESKRKVWRIFQLVEVPV